MFRSHFQNLSILCLTLFFVISCTRNNDNTTPTTLSVTTTIISNILSNTASGGGVVVSTGSVTTRGVCWSIATGPTINDNKTSDGAGTGNFTSSLTGLTPGTLYYVRAYATNSDGTVYGNEVSFTTSTPIPTVSTASVTGIALTSGISGGSITSIETVTSRGVCWNTFPSPSVSNNKTIDGTGTGNFTSQITGLTAFTTYYVRAYAVTNSGIFYGDQLTFTTLQDTSPGAVDYSFNSGSSFDVHVYAIKEQSDGKILVGGQFRNYNGIARNKIARLNSDGTLDMTFNIGTGFDDDVNEIVIQPDGKILVAGLFNTYKGASVRAIVRLNSDGSIDPSFNAPNLITDINSFALLPDGKIVALGNIGSASGNYYNIIRLFPDGSTDPSFVPSMSLQVPKRLAVQSDGKIIVVSVGPLAAKLIRFNPNGSTDNSFIIGSGFDINAWVDVVQLLPDGKILIGGNFTNFNGISCNSICRLNTDGSFDNTFTGGSGFETGVSAGTLALQPDGKIIVGGSFNTFAGQSHIKMVRLNPSGSRDATFSTGSTFDNFVYAITVLANGKIMSSGRYFVPGVGFSYVRRLHGN